MTQENKLSRDKSYGSLVPPTNQPNNAYQTAYALVMQAIKAKKLDSEYVSVDKKHRGSALSYDLYDIKGQTVLIQRRYTVCDKYGNHPTKSYWLVRKIGTGVRVESMDQYKAKIVKLAKTVDDLGDLIDCLRGKAVIKIKNASSAVRTAYKQVAVVDGRFYSIFDGKTEYTIESELIQAAKADHAGGYYVYMSADSAARAAVPEESVLFAAPRTVLQVQVTGTHIEYGNGKISFTRIKPIAEVVATQTAT